MTDTPTTPNRAYGDGPIAHFWNGGGRFPNFHFKRHFRQDPSEPMPSLASILLPRFNPIPHYQGSGVPLPRADMLLPDTAPGDISSIEGLLARFDVTPPLRQDVYAEFKITLSQDIPAHAQWEIIRAWAREHFVLERSLAALMVLHRPDLAGSHNPAHVHIFVPARRLSIHGFGEKADLLCSDMGQREAWESWSAAREAALTKG